MIFETSIRSYNRRSNRNFSFFLAGFLPKHHAQEGRVSLYKGYFYDAAFPGTSEVAEGRSRFEQEEEDSGRGSRGTTLGGGPKASQRPPSLNAGKRKANEMVNSGASTEPANRRPAPAAAFTSVTGEQAALGSWQLRPTQDWVTYAASLAGPVVLSKPSGSLKPTAMDSDMSEPAVSSEISQ